MHQAKQMPTFQVKRKQRQFKGIRDSDFGEHRNKIMHFRATSKHIEPPHDKIIEMACAPCEDSDQPGQLLILIRVFAMRSMGS